MPHPRYSAPQAEDMFSPEETLRRWKMITDQYAETLAGRSFAGYRCPTPGAVATREISTGHDVVAFLSMYTQSMPDEDKTFIHRGLTSSDLVDNGMFMACRQHARYLANRLDEFDEVLSRMQQTEVIRAGRTHGQLAAPTTLNHQLDTIRVPMREISNDLRDYTTRGIFKSPGPTGWANTADMERAKQVADRLSTRTFYVVPSTQVIPRDYLLRWACLYLRAAAVVENFALLVRLGSRSEVRELREGATANRVGSSSMPTKQNPIDSEKICGLANVVRGQFTTIASNTALWEERDLTNSSLERITVPDLAATVEHIVDTGIKVAMGLRVMRGHAAHTLARNAGVWVALAQRTLQEVAMYGPIEAGDMIRKIMGRDGVERQNPHYLFQFGYAVISEEIDKSTATAWYDLMRAQYRALTSE